MLKPFSRKNPLAITPLALALAMALGFPSCSNTGPETGSVAITAPLNNATVPGPDVTITIQTTAFTGHFHVFVDENPTPGGGSTLRGSNSMTLPLDPGMHTVTVQGAADPDHHFIAGVKATVHFTVQ